jgi:uncharacterized RDD family membrane protein YckC
MSNLYETASEARVIKFEPLVKENGMSGCYRCGAPEGNQAKLCPACNRKRMRHDRHVGDKIAQAKFKSVVVIGDGEPAGFWVRLATYLIDGAIMATFQSGIMLVLLVATRTDINSFSHDILARLDVGVYGLGAVCYAVVWLVVSTIVSLAISFLYRPLFECSALSATPGKFILNVTVGDRYGHRISVAQAFAREAVRMFYLLPPLLLIGVAAAARQPVSAAGIVLVSFVAMLVAVVQYCMIWFSDNGTTLRDLVTGTRVVMKGGLVMTELPKKALISFLIIAGGSTVAYLADSAAKKWPIQQPIISTYVEVPRGLDARVGR